MTDKNLDAQAEELAAYLDDFMARGGGHVNVTAGGQTLCAKERISNDCMNANAPCRIPNLGGEEKENEK